MSDKQRRTLPPSGPRSSRRPQGDWVREKERDYDNERDRDRDRDSRDRDRDFDREYSHESSRDGGYLNGSKYRSYKSSSSSSSSKYYGGPGDPRRYSERDNYRPGRNFEQESNGANSHNTNIPPRSRPLGPSGAKRPFPAEPRSFRDESSRKRHEVDDLREDLGSKKVNLIALPRGPRSELTQLTTPSGPSAGRIKGKFGRGGYSFKGSERPPRPTGPSGAVSASRFHNSADSSKSGAVVSLKTRSVAPKYKKSQVYSVKIERGDEVFKRVQQVGEGTYGKVYKAINVITHEHVALKKLRLESEREGFPITAIREMKLLQLFDHPNVIGLLEMMVEYNYIYMIFDYMDHDLTGLLTHPDLHLQELHRKHMFKQLMEGLEYLHKKRVIHRDIKGSNILLDNKGALRIADFGLARTMKIVHEGESPDYTNRVITIWYRPPELLLGLTDYGREVDIWGVGCLLIELYTKVSPFQGFEEIGQLYRIFSIMGTPTLENWPDIDKLPWFEMLQPAVHKSSTFHEKYSTILSEQAFDLALKLLTLNPSQRYTATQALEHQYFREDPQPEPLTEILLTIEGEWHEFETKKQRRKERKRLQDLANTQAKEKEEPTKEEGTVNPQTNEIAPLLLPSVSMNTSVREETSSLGMA